MRSLIKQIERSEREFARLREDLVKETKSVSVILERISKGLEKDLYCVYSSTFMNEISRLEDIKEKYLDCEKELNNLRFAKECIDYDEEISNLSKNT